MRPRALVTGGAARVGRAIALELARSGCDVAIHHNRTPVDDVLAECRALGADAWEVSADLGDVAGCEQVVAAVRERWSDLRILVNNASAFEPLPFADITADAWDRMQAINLRAPFLLSRGLLPELQRAGGVVVHLCDIGADRPISGYAH